MSSSTDHPNSSQSYSQYQSLREQILALNEDCLAWLKAVDALVPTTAAINTLKQNQERLRQDRFSLVVVGEFSSGKSYFINVLLNRIEKVQQKSGKFKVRGMLPDRISPTTSVITVIRYGEHERATVVYRSGKQLQVQLDELGQHLAEPAFAERWFDVGRAMLGQPRSEDPRRDAVERVEIECPAPLLRHGVEIVDTPGTGSVLKEHGIVTRQHIPQADAILFLFAAQPPINNETRLFLSQCRFQVDRFLFVQTMKDREYDFSNGTATPHRQKGEAVIDVATRQNAAILSAELGKPPQIHAISSQWAAFSRTNLVAPPENISGFPQLEAALEAFLVTNRGMDRLRQNVHQAKRVLEPALTALETLQSQQGNSLAEVREQIEAQKPLVEEIHALARELEDTVYVELEGLFQDVEDSRDECASFLRDSVIPKIRDMSYAQLPHAARDVALYTNNAMNAWIIKWTNGTVSSRLRKLQEQLRTKGRELERAVRRLGNISENLQEANIRTTNALSFRLSPPNVLEIEARMKPLILQAIEHQIGSWINFFLPIQGAGTIIGTVAGVLVPRKMENVRDKIEDSAENRMGIITTSIVNGYRDFLRIEANAIRDSIAAAAEAAIDAYDSPLRKLEKNLAENEKRVRLEEKRIMEIHDLGRQQLARCNELLTVLQPIGYDQ